MEVARDRLIDAVSAELNVTVSSAEAVSGGSINHALRLELSSGERLFLKHRPGADAAEFEAEAAGLAWLAEADALPVPRPMARGHEPHPWLALAWVDEGSIGADGAEELGRGLARLHQAGAARIGALPPGAPDRYLRIGAVRLDLATGRTPGEDSALAWPEFYAEAMIRPLCEAAVHRGAIDGRGAGVIGQVCDRIEAVAGPAEPPARLHGDLWAGNVHPDREGRPWLIDPAAYGGHREMDLAMLRLFGTPGGERVFSAYGEEYPLAEGHRERVGLWQLQPLLVHAVLFGGGYGDQAVATARRYL